MPPNCSEIILTRTILYFALVFQLLIVPCIHANMEADVYMMDAHRNVNVSQDLLEVHAIKVGVTLL